MQNIQTGYISYMLARNYIENRDALTSEEKTDLETTINTIVEKLPPKNKYIVYLFLKGKTQTDIHTETNTSEVTIKNVLSQFLKDISAKLDLQDEKFITELSEPDYRKQIVRRYFHNRWNDFSY